MISMRQIAVSVVAVAVFGWMGTAQSPAQTTSPAATRPATQRASRQSLKIHGSVVDAESGKPIEKFKIVTGGTWPQAAEQKMWDRRTPLTGRDGQYEITPIVRYPLSLIRVEADGYKPAVSRAFRNDEGEQTFDVKLEKGKAIAGTVRGPDGKPVAGATVVLAVPGQMAYIQNARQVMDQGCPQCKTDDSGKYQFPAEDGAFTIVVIHDAGYAELDNAAFARSPDLTLSAWGRIEGVVMKGKQPAAGQKLQVNAAEDSYDPSQPRIYHGIDGKADADGKFVIERVPPGEMTISRVNEREQGMRFGSGGGTPVTVAAGKTTTVQLGGNGRPVVGKLTAPAGVALTWTKVQGGLQGMPREFPVPSELQPAMDKVRMQMSDPATTIQQKQKWLEDWRKSSDGQALQEAEQRFQRQAYRSVSQYALTVDKDAAFRADDVPPGDYMLNFYASDEGLMRLLRGLTFQAQQEVRVEAGDADKPVDVGQIALMTQGATTPTTAPAVAMKFLDGQPLKMSDYQGKYVLLSFWASWCASCEPAIDRIAEVQAAFGKDSRLVILGMNLDETPDAARLWVQNRRMTWPQVALGDWKQTTVPQFYGVQSVPAAVLVGPDGKIVAQNLAGMQINDAVSKALAGN